MTMTPRSLKLLLAFSIGMNAVFDAGLLVAAAGDDGGKSRGPKPASYAHYKMMRVLDKAEVTPETQAKLEEHFEATSEEISNMFRDMRREQYETVMAIILEPDNPENMKAIDDEATAFHQRATTVVHDSIRDAARLMSVEERQRVVDTMRADALEWQKRREQKAKESGTK